MKTEMTCEDVIARLFVYLDRELDAGTSKEIERHLETCRACFTRAEFEKRIKAKVAEAGSEKAPASLLRRVRSLLEGF